MKVLIHTDLEGASGIERFDQIRRGDATRESFLECRKWGTEDINAAINGVRDAQPDAEITVVEGHYDSIDRELLDTGVGYFKLEAKERAAAFLRENSFDCAMIVGQHAMEDTSAAPLAHTYSSHGYHYYKLNGEFIGEIMGVALKLGAFGIPLIFLTGDDKACLEAERTIPGIVTAAVKTGLAIDKADCLPFDKARELIRQKAAEAISRREQVKPLVLAPPYALEARIKKAKLHSITEHIKAGARQTGPDTVIYESESLFDLPI